MKAIAVILVIICLGLALIGWRLFMLEDILRGYAENTELVIRSNHDLINQNARLEQALVNLQKQVESFKDSMPRR